LDPYSHFTRIGALVFRNSAYEPMAPNQRYVERVPMDLGLAPETSCRNVQGTRAVNKPRRIKETAECRAAASLAARYDS